MNDNENWHVGTILLSRVVDRLATAIGDDQARRLVVNALLDGACSAIATRFTSAGNSVGACVGYSNERAPKCAARFTLPREFWNRPFFVKGKHHTEVVQNLMVETLVTTELFADWEESNFSWQYIAFDKLSRCSAFGVRMPDADAEALLNRVFGIDSMQTVSNPAFVENVVRAGRTEMEEIPRQPTEEEIATELHASAHIGMKRNQSIDHLRKLPRFAAVKVDDARRIWRDHSIGPRGRPTNNSPR